MILKIIAFPFMCLISLLVLAMFIFTIPIGIVGFPLWLILSMWQEDVGMAFECAWEFMMMPISILGMLWNA